MSKTATAAQIERARAALQIKNPIYRGEMLDNGTIVLYVVNYREPVQFKPRKRRAKKAET